jgi:hypothetical protein
MPGRPLATACAWLVLAGGAAGAWMLRRRRELLILLAPLILATVTTLVAFGYPRFRYAADVGLIVLASYAAVRRRSALSRT